MLFKKKNLPAPCPSSEKMPKEEEYDAFRDLTQNKALRIIFIPFSLSVMVLVISLFSRSFAEGYSRTFGSFVRALLANLTGILPFSLAETLLGTGLVLLLYGILRCLYEAIRKVPYEKRFERTFNRVLVGVVMVCFTLYGLGFAPCNRRRTLADNLGIARDAVTAQQLYDCLLFVQQELKDCTDAGIRYDENHLSCLPYSYDELSLRMNEAYQNSYDTYPFLSRIHAPVKRIALSELMTYTHISGIYIPYTGEANININYPDYVVAFSTAHEMAHQRGIAREDEANFTAFLIMYNSGDNYFRYAAFMELYDYLSNALYTASEDLFYSALRQAPVPVLKEMMGFQQFFSPYSGSAASKVANTVNDASIRLRGDAEGARSYDMMVELAIAYFDF